MKECKTCRQKNPQYINASLFKKRRIEKIVLTGNCCEECGKTAEENSWLTGLHLHHLDGSRDNHALENLILLCAKCHKRKHL